VRRSGHPPVVPAIAGRTESAPTPRRRGSPDRRVWVSLNVRRRALVLLDAGELGACWRQREGGQWSSLLSPFHFPWTSQGPSPPSGAHGGVLHGRPSSLGPNKHPRRTPQRRGERRRPRQLVEMRLHCARPRRPCRMVFEEPPERRRSSAALRSRSASSGTCTPRSRLAALSTEWSGRNPPRSRSLINDHGVDSAFLTRWASTSQLPARTPGRFIPRRLVQCHDAVGKLVT
jgi:hypothetical protein